MPSASFLLFAVDSFRVTASASLLAPLARFESRREVCAAHSFRLPSHRLSPLIHFERWRETGAGSPFRVAACFPV
jgi:hypothetical protein